MKYFPLTSKHLNDACIIIQKTLFTTGRIYRAVGCHKDPNAVDELNQINLVVAKDGISVVALDPKTEQIVGACFNKIMLKSEPFFESFKTTLKNPKALEILDYRLNVSKLIDVFDHYQTECLIEVLYLGVLQPYRNKGVATQLGKLTMEIGQNLFNGNNVKQPLNNEKLSLEPVAEAIYGVTASPYSRLMAKDISFETLLEIDGIVLDNPKLHKVRLFVEDTLQCQQLTPEYLEDALNLMDTSFFRYENVSTVLEISKDPEALKELRQLTTAAAKDGVTVIAIDRKSNKVVGAAFNKLQIRDNPAFENLAKSWKNSRSRAIVQLMAEIDNLCNLFDHCQVDCLLELMFLTTSPDYRGKGIGKKLCEATIEIGKNLARGVNVKKSMDGQKLDLEPSPKIVSAIFTSFVTQKIGRQLEFEIIAEKNYNEFEYDGKNYASVIPSSTPKLTLEYKKLI